jgi:RNA recognition motif-containing protein
MSTASQLASLRLRGLPYQADERDVRAFFQGFDLVKTVVVRKNGKPTGEGYVFFNSEAEASAALMKKNRESMGNRYIEIFADSKSSSSSTSGGPAGRSGPVQVNGMGGKATTTSHHLAGGHANGRGGREALPMSNHHHSQQQAAQVHHSPLLSGMTYAQASKAASKETTVTTTAQEQVQAPVGGGGASQVSSGAGYFYAVNGGVGGQQQQNGGNVVEFSPTVSEANSTSSACGSGSNNGAQAQHGGRSGSMTNGGVNGSAMANNRPVIVRVRGLPFSAQERDVRGFFDGLSVKEIVFTLTPNGRPTGEAFVEFMENVLLQNVLAFHKQMLGKRYIEIFKASKQELVEAARSLPGYHHKAQYSQNQTAGKAMQGGHGYPAGSMSSMASGQSMSQRDQVQSSSIANVNKSKHVNNITGKTRMLSNAPKGTVLKLRGLPYTTEESDIRSFFSDYMVLGVVLMTRPEREGRLGTCNGVAYVQFNGAQEAEGARQQKHKEVMGNRYIECMTHIPKGTPPLSGQPGDYRFQHDMADMADMMVGQPPAAAGAGVVVAGDAGAVNGGGARPLQTMSSENVDYILPNDFFRNIKTAIPQYYGGEVNQNNHAMPVANANATQPQGHPPAMTQQESLAQQLEKMGLTEKGESLFSQGLPPWAGQINQNTTNNNNDDSNTSNPDPWAMQSVSEQRQSQEQQDFTNGAVSYSPVLDSRFKHLW